MVVFSTGEVKMDWRERPHYGLLANPSWHFCLLDNSFRARPAFLPVVTLLARSVLRDLRGDHDAVQIGRIAGRIPQADCIAPCMQLDRQNNWHRIAEGAAIQI